MIIIARVCSSHEDVRSFVAKLVPQADSAGLSIKRQAINHYWFDAHDDYESDIFGLMNGIEAVADGRLPDIVCVSVPGRCNRTKTGLVWSADLPDWVDKPLACDLRAVCNTAIWIDGARGEDFLKAARNFERLIETEGSEWLHGKFQRHATGKVQ